MDIPLSVVIDTVPACFRSSARPLRVQSVRAFLSLHVSVFEIGSRLARTTGIFDARVQKGKEEDGFGVRTGYRKVLTPLPCPMELARRVTTKMIEDHKRLTEEHGKGKEWEGKPASLASRLRCMHAHIILICSLLALCDVLCTPQNDFLQWMLDVGEPADTTTEALTKQLVLLNFAAIHPTALVCGHHLLPYLR